MTNPTISAETGHPVQSAAAQRGSIEVREMAPGEEQEWDDFVYSSPWGTFFHLAGWKPVIETVLRRRCFYLTARDRGGITGVLPLTWVRSRLFGDCLVSSPLVVYGGVCANEEDSCLALLNAARELGEKLGVKYVELRNRTEPFPTGLPGRGLHVIFTQDLTPGPDALMKQLPRDTRYIIRKSLKSGLEWTEDLGLADFYEIFAQSFHRLGTPVFPRELFSRIQSEFAGRCRLFGVRKQGKAVAGVLCFYFNDQVLPYYAGALPEFYADSPNNFMYWNLICQSCREGYRIFDFGRSKKGSGSFKFKSSWSAEVTELPYRYQLIRAKEPPKLSPADKTFQLPIAVWKRLPLAVTKIVGPAVIRRVPSV